MEQIRIWLQTAAILVAIGVFITREILEYRRRQTSKSRKILAIKIVLARACELNNWTIKALKRQLTTIQDSVNPAGSVFIKFLQGGRIRFVETDGNSESSSIIPEVDASDLKIQLLPIAELDEQLTALLEAAISGLAELHHVRDSMVRYVSGEEGLRLHEVPDNDFLKTFAEYGLEELEDSYNALNALYVGCTGSDLTSHRVR